ncbi:uncharacterized protein LOC122510490 [Leptopilina heterotoma]|uniref:uncharacterized protein LOC122510490 n=1 Tax=Leptopilina heterotoma TaxID=63436 RepID=UPI001CA8B960|nr:uncharacterized protein LOC122510490 [Leptopilina heterotoma]
MWKQKPLNYKRYLQHPNVSIPRSTLFRRKASHPAHIKEYEEYFDRFKDKSQLYCDKGTPQFAIEEAITEENEVTSQLANEDVITEERNTLTTEEKFQIHVKRKRTSSFGDYGPSHTTSVNDDSNADATSLHLIVDDIDSAEEEFHVKNLLNEVSNVHLQEMEEALNMTDDFSNVFFNKDGENNSPFKKLNTLINNHEFSEIISQPINKTLGELLMILLKFAVTHSLSLTAVTQLFLLINSMFSSPILPESRYLINTLFNPSSNATFHGMCPQCSYIGIFKRSDKSIKCTFCDLDVQVKSSSYNDFFVYFDINSQISELVETNSDYYYNVMNRRRYENNVFKDIYDGQMYRAFVNSLDDNDRHQYLTTTFNTDGAPLFESSAYSIWPLFLQINELPYQVRTNELILCALWFGKSKPNMNVFLKPFVANMNKLSAEGVKCKVKEKVLSVKVYSLCCCVDSICRPTMQGFCQFNGKYGCPWCLHPGQWVSNPTTKNGGSQKYPLLDAPVSRRTVQDTLRHMEIATPNKPCFGIKHPSELINLNNFDIIDGFVPDPMHIVSNVGKLFTHIWFGTKSVSSAYLTKDKLIEINSIMTKIKVPCQVGRLSRSLDDKEFWKAREWENWILYYSIPIISLFLDSKYIMHWLLLVEAFYILSKERITIDDLNHADKLLHKFVADTENLYSSVAMTFNVHILLHLARSVFNWGPLFAHSCYGFESGNGQLLKTIHSAKGVHHQVARHVAFNFSHLFVKKAVYDNCSTEMKHYYDSLGHAKVQNTLKTQKARYFGMISAVEDAWKIKLELSENSVCYSKMVKNGCLYLSSERINQRSDNAFVLLHNGSYANIFKFIVDRELNKEYALVQVLRTKNAFSRNHRTLQIIEEIDSEITSIFIHDIHKISVCIDIPNENCYISAVPNLLSY